MTLSAFQVQILQGSRNIAAIAAELTLQNCTAHHNCRAQQAGASPLSEPRHLVYTDTGELQMAGLQLAADWCVFPNNDTDLLTRPDCTQEHVHTCSVLMPALEYRRAQTYKHT